ncbi:MAG TPA: hypothetical protein VKC53_03995 [Patescibacteria group bacterium]|nr:hypothetical protein [Patescibacteria group bacterium]
MLERLITNEVGSLAKPEWRVKGISGNPIGQKEVDQAKKWGQRLQIDNSPLLEILLSAQESGLPLSPEQKKEIRHWASVYGTRLQEVAGLDVIYDGEQNRSEMYEHAVNRSQGFESRGLVRAFDNKYYRKFAVTQEPSIKDMWHTDELLEIQRITDKDIKVPITGAYTIAAWSFDEHYRKQSTLQNIVQVAKESRHKFTLDVARNLIRPNLEDLIAKGARWIQIDEPAATTVPSEVPLFVAAFNESTKDLDCKFSVHICFSDYSLLFPHITQMQNCSQYSLEFANRDSRELGTHDGDRPAYEVLRLFKQHGIDSSIGLGVVDIHTDFIESPELVRDRIIYASELLGDPKRINPSPDCGLRTRTWDVAFEKLSSTVNGARLAEKLL